MATDTTSAESARQQAHQILSHAPYTNAPSSVPHPLAGVLHTIGRWLDDVFGPVWRWITQEVFAPIGRGFFHLFGGAAWIVGAALAVLAGVLVAVVLARRRSRIGATVEGLVTSGTPGDPKALEAEADRRAAAGDFSGAVRLRFEAGLLRLELAGIVPDQLVRTGTEVAGRIGSPTFDHLAGRHEAVAYAGRPAAADDVDEARSGWPRVPGEARAHLASVEVGAS